MTPSPRPSRLLRLTALLFALMGLGLLGGGVWLIALGGSWFYALAGLGLLATAGFLAAGRPLALWLFAALLASTLLWSLWEVGLDWWAVAIRGDVPFVLGELPQGGCCSGHNTLVHQAADMLPKGAWVSQQGTNVMDEYHFDHASVVIMGKRYGETMLKELGW